MADRSGMSPLSGEIMASSSPVARRRATEFVDAEFVTLDPPASHRPTRVSEPHKAAPAGMELLGVAGARRWFQPAGWGFWATGSVLALAAFWVAGGHSVVGKAIGGPEVASRLRVELVSSRIDGDGARPQLLIDGTLDNPAAIPLPIGDVLIRVTASDGKIVHYRIGAGGGDLEPGGLWRFSSRLDAPSSGVRSIAVDVTEKGKG